MVGLKFLLSKGGLTLRDMLLHALLVLLPSMVEVWGYRWQGWLLWGVSHEVAPLSDGGLGGVSHEVAPLNDGGLGGVSHEVAPLSDGGLGGASHEVAPLSDGGLGGVSHEVAPLNDGGLGGCYGVCHMRLLPSMMEVWVVAMGCVT